jgi:hypothetical protein
MKRLSPMRIQDLRPFNMRQRTLVVLGCIACLHSVGRAELYRLQPIVDGRRVGSGCIIQGIREKSAAASADLRIADTIVEANGQAIQSADDLLAVVRSASADMPLIVERAGRTVNLTAQLAPASLNTVRLGVVCAPPFSVPLSIQVASYTITAQASLVQNLTMVHVDVTNQSRRTLHVTPHLFAAADGNKLMLKLLEPANVTTILQGDLAAIPRVPDSQPVMPDPAVGTLTRYLFGSMGMKGDTALIASGLTEGAILALSHNQPEPMTAPPDITPALVAREALDVSDLEPTYTAEGIVFFTAPKALPITLMVNIEGHKESIVFDSPSISAQVPTAGGSFVGSSAPSALQQAAYHQDCPFDVKSGQSVHVILKSGKDATGRVANCDSHLSIHSGLMYWTYNFEDIKSVVPNP